MQSARCKCGEKRTFGSMFPPCNVCDKCGTAPGYADSDEPAAHRFSRKYDQKTGKPFDYCSNCGKKQEVSE